MRNALLLLLAGTIGAPGCIIYDDTQTLETEDDRTLERDERDQIEEEDDGLASEFDLYVTPNEAEAGETFIASVRTATEHSLLDVTGVKRLTLMVVRDWPAGWLYGAIAWGEPTLERRREAHQ